MNKKFLFSEDSVCKFDVWDLLCGILNPPWALRSPAASFGVFEFIWALEMAFQSISEICEEVIIRPLKVVYSLVRPRVKTLIVFHIRALGLILFLRNLNV